MSATYTIIAARFAGPGDASAIVQTVEAGAVAISAQDTPAVWQDLLDSGVPIEPAEVTSFGAAAARAERNVRLAASTWIIERHQDELLAGRTPTLSPAQLAAWLSYRQALRDQPAQEGFPVAVIWPEAPA